MGRILGEKERVEIEERVTDVYKATTIFKDCDWLQCIFDMNEYLYTCENR